jgi:hypothetical protein
MLDNPGRILRAAKAAGGHARRCARYWLGAGVARMRRPMVPRRSGYGPFKSAGRYAALLLLYPVALAGWLAGGALRPISVIPDDDAAEFDARRRRARRDTVRHLPILDAEECAAIVDRVHELRSLWVFRQPGFFTLGRAAYMDCRSPPAREHYLREAGWLNEELLRGFAPLYDNLIATLEEALGEPCRLIEWQAIPGFHIWLGRGIPRIGFDAASVHFDLQYFDLGLDGGEWPTLDEVVSFTLPVRLPQAGGGLNVWDVTHPEQVGWEAWPYKAVSRVPYSVGSLVLHTGHEMHQIAPVERIAEGDQRVCLQGHGIRKDGAWLLYW